MHFLLLVYSSTVPRHSGRTRASRETFVRSCNRLLGGWVEKKIVDTIASSLCPAPAALTSCEGGRAAGAVQSRLLSRFRPSREYFIGIGLRPVAIRLGCVCSSATRTRLFWPIRAMHSAGSAHVIEPPRYQKVACAGPLHPRQPRSSPACISVLRSGPRHATKQRSERRRSRGAGPVGSGSSGSPAAKRACAARPGGGEPGLSGALRRRGGPS